MMRFSTPVRALFAASALLAASAFASAPAFAQNQGNEGPSRLETFKDDAGGFFGKIFGGDDQQQQQQQRQPAPYGSAGQGSYGGSAQGSYGGAPQAPYGSSRQAPYGGGSGQVAQSSSSDMFMRINELEAQLRQMTGQMEELQHRNQQLEQQLRRVQGDNEYLTNQRAGGERAGERVGARTPPPSAPPVSAPPSAPPVASAPPPAGGPSPGRRSDVFDPRQDPNAPGAPRALGALPPGQPSAPPAPSEANGEPPASVRGGREAGDPLDLSTLSERAANDPALDPGPAPRGGADGGQPRVIPGALPAPPPRNPNATGGQVLASAPSDAPRDEFALAYGYVQRKDYALAEDALRAFLQKHPTDRLAADANYWLGETLFQRQRYRDAAESFLTVSTKFERSDKAPDALLRLGQSLAALGEREAACATLGEVTRKFPRAGNALKQSVGREQKRARC